PTPSITPLSLHDALPILMLVKTRATAQAVQPAGASREPGSNLGGSSSSSSSLIAASDVPPDTGSAVTAYPEKKSRAGRVLLVLVDRKSTRLNSSHVKISY